MEEETPTQPGELSKAERKAQRRQERQRAQEEAARNSARRRVFIWSAAVLIPMAVIGLFIWKVMSAPTIPEHEIAADNGVHWHTKLDIIIKGDTVQIPANVGIAPGQVHPENMHTHETDNVVHIEKAGVVRYDDLRLHHFFEVWEKQFNSQCILEHCTGEEGTVKMFVNGQESTDFERYIQRDGDRIEIRFE